MTNLQNIHFLINKRRNEDVATKKITSLFCVIIVDILSCSHGNYCLGFFSQDQVTMEACLALLGINRYLTENRVCML